MPTPADKSYVNRSREAEYVSALEQAAVEVNSLRAVLTAVLLVHGKTTVTQEKMDTVVKYEVDLQQVEDTYIIEAVEPQKDGENDDD